MILFEEILDSYHYKLDKNFSPSFHYETFYDDLLKLLKLNKSEAPELHILNSKNRKTYYRQHEKNHHIIYDQYLGSTMSHLYRIFANSTNDEDIITFCFKMLAENEQIEGNFKEGHFLSTVYSTRRNVFGLSFQNESAPLLERGIMVAVQEAFMICHELLLFCLNDYKTKIFEVWMNVDSKDKLLEKIKSRIVVLVDHMKATGLIGEKTIAQDFLTNDYLAEKVCADSLAFMLLRRIFLDKYQVYQTTVSRGIYFCITNLMFLEFIDIFHKSEKKQDVSKSIYNDALTIRRYILGNTFYQHISQSSSEEMAANNDNDLLDLEVSYFEKIFKPLIYNLKKEYISAISQLNEKLSKSEVDIEDIIGFENISILTDYHLYGNKQSFDNLNLEKVKRSNNF